MALTDLITPQWVKDRFLVGVNLTTDDGLPYPDELFEIAIASAIDAVQDELDIVFDDVTVTNEKHDSYGNSNGAPNFAPIRLRKRPVRSITGITAAWGNNSPITIPVSWANMAVDGLDFTGQLEIIPNQDAVSTLSSYGLPGLYRDVSPLWWRIAYQAGWEDPEDVPPGLLMAIGWIASALPLDTAGDLIAGAGIANKSVSIDGLSTSVGTTSSATNAGYGARLMSYQKQVSVQLAAAKNKYMVREFTAI